MSEIVAAKARSAHDVIRYIDEFRPGSREAVRATFPDGLWERITTAARTAWIPITDDHHVVDGIVSVLGVSDAATMWESFLLDHIRSPLLRTMVEGGLRMLGSSPATFAWLLPKAWPGIYRGVATPELLERSDSHAVVELRDVAEVFLAYPAYMTCLEANFKGFFLAAKTPGELEFVVDRTQRTIRSTWRW